MKTTVTVLFFLSMLISFSFFSDCIFASESVFVFVTSKRYDGNLGGVEGANEICQEHAEAAGLPGEYKAWISSSTEQSPAHTFNKSTKP